MPPLLAHSPKGGAHADAEGGGVDVGEDGGLGLRPSRTPSRAGTADSSQPATAPLPRRSGSGAAAAAAAVGVGVGARRRPPPLSVGGSSYASGASTPRWAAGRVAREDEPLTPPPLGLSASTPVGGPHGGGGSEPPRRPRAAAALGGGAAGGRVHARTASEGPALSSELLDALRHELSAGAAHTPPCALRRSHGVLSAVSAGTQGTQGTHRSSRSRSRSALSADALMLPMCAAQPRAARATARA